MKALENAVEIVGKRNKHLGPRMDYAKVTIRVEPSDGFDVVDLIDQRDEARRFGFPDKFVFGFLDALGSDRDNLRLRLILKSVDLHPIDSSPQAFVEAGRDAGRKLAEMLGLS